MQGQCQVEIYLVNYCRAYVQIELPVTLRAILKNLAYYMHHKSLILLNCFEILLVPFLVCSSKFDVFGAQPKIVFSGFVRPKDFKHRW